MDKKMITFEDAKKTALSKATGIDVCDEYEKGYHFFSKDTDSDGGFGDIVVLKENGRTLSFTQFILDYLPEKKPKRVDLEGAENRGGAPTIGIMDDGWQETIRRALEGEE